MVKFEKPSGIIDFTICNITKKVPRPACPVEKEIYKKGTEPRKTANCTGLNSFKI